jgi:hypothetical protein
MFTIVSREAVADLWPEATMRTALDDAPHNPAGATIPGAAIIVPEIRRSELIIFRKAPKNRPALEFRAIIYGKIPDYRRENRPFRNFQFA